MAGPRWRLLVVDLDGTVRSRRLGITAGVRAAVAGARARGVRVCVATGRMWRSAAPWLEALGADPPAILYNGARIFDFARGRVLFDRRLAAATVRGVLDLVRRDPEMQPHLYVRDQVHVERRHPLTEAFAADDGVDYRVVPAFESLLEEDPHKLLVIGAPARIQALEALVWASGLPLHATRSEPAYLEVLPPGVSKGAALALLAEGLGLRLADVVAVGDNWNDLEMIQAAGLGVAMGQAPPEVRALADHVCGTAEEEGVREVIERFILPAGS
jgi:Cof subfamily protein (haloacid dehalogenase superfamily)